MAAFFDPKAAKRLVTYGKSSKKPDRAYDTFFRRDATATSRTSTAKDIPSRPSDDRDELSLSQNSDTQEQGLLRKVSRYPAPKSLRAVKPNQPSLATSRDPSNDLYDIPSSEDELSFGLLSPRKRRRLTPVEEKNARDGAAKPLGSVALGKDTKPNKPTRQPRPFHGTSDKTSAASATNSSHRGYNGASNLKHKPQDVDLPRRRQSDSVPPARNGVSTTSKPFVETDLAITTKHGNRPTTPTKPISNATSRWTRSSPRQTLSKPITPERRIEVAAASPETTPKQAQLLNDLLGSDNSELPHATLNRTFQRNHSGAATKASQSLKPNISQTSRTRLVDTLNRSSKAFVSSGDSKDEVSSDEEMYSTPILQDKPNQPRPSVKPPEEEPQSSQASSQTSGTRVTYARQRSYLSQNMVGDVEDLGIASPPPFLEVRAAGSSAGTSIGTLPHQLDLVSDDETAGPSQVRSLHELRQAGGNARFNGETEALFEDIEDQSPGFMARKRTALLSLCSKLTESTFARQFLDTAQEQRLAVCCQKESDLVSCFLLNASFSLLLNITLPVSKLVVCLESVVVLARSMLKFGQDLTTIAKDRKTNMSKIALGSLRAFCDVFSRSEIWDRSKAVRLTPRFLALKNMEVTIRRVRETGDARGHIPDDVLCLITSSLLKEAPGPGLPETGTYSFHVLEVAMSLLESYSCAGAMARRTDDEDWSVSLQDLARVTPLVVDLTCREQIEYQGLQILAIRLVLNITNENDFFCEKFATPQLITGLSSLALRHFSVLPNSILPSHEASLDVLILSLGCLLNLGERSSTARRVFLSDGGGSGALIAQFLDLFKWGLERTSQVCLTSKVPNVSSLTIPRQAESLEEMHANIALGYLAIMLGTLCVDNEMRTFICGQLPGRRLDSLVAAIEDFLRLYRKVEEEEADASKSFTTRFRKVVEQLRAK